MRVNESRPFLHLVDGSLDTTDIPGPDAYAVTAPPRVASDAGASVTGRIRVHDEDGDAVTFTAASSPVSGDSYGTLAMGTDGNWTFTVDGSNADVSALTAGEELETRYLVTATDAVGNAASAELDITIIGNTAPVIDAALLPLSIRDVFFVYPVKTGDITFEIGNKEDEQVFNLPLDIEKVGAADDHLKVTFPLRGNNGSWDGLVEGINSNATAQEFIREVTLNSTPPLQNLYEMHQSSDGNPSYYTNNAGFIVFELYSDYSNVPLVALSDGNTPAHSEQYTLKGTSTGAAITEDTEAGIRGKVYASDADGDVLAYSAALKSGVSYGDFVINSLGEWIFTLDNSVAAVQDLNDGDTLSTTYTVTVADTLNSRATTDIAITINGRDEEAPSIGTFEGETVLHWLAFKTIKPVETILITAQGTADFPRITELTGGTGMLAGAFAGSLGSVTMQDMVDYLNSHTVASEYITDVRVADGFSGGDDAFAPLRERPSKNGSLLTPPIERITLDAGSRVTIVAGDTDAILGQVPGTDPDGDDGALTYSQVLKAGETSYGTLTMAADGSYSYTLDNSNAAVTALTGGSSLTSTYSVTVTDSGGLSATADMTITIEGNVAPVISSDAPHTVVFLSYLGAGIYQPVVTDGNSFDTYTLSVSGTDAALFEIRGGTAIRLKAVDEAAFSLPAKGYYEFTVTATDKVGLTGTQDVVLGLKDILDKPNIGTDTPTDATDDYYGNLGAGSDDMFGRFGEVDRFIVETDEKLRAPDMVFNATVTGEDKIVTDVADTVDTTTITAANFTEKTGLRFEQITTTTVDGDMHDTHIIWNATDEVVMIVDGPVDGFGAYAFDFTDFEFI